MALPSDALLSPVWTHLTSIVAQRAKRLRLRSGRHALPGFHLWHRRDQHRPLPPKVVRAIQDQAARLLHGQANIMLHPPLLELAAELRSIAPRLWIASSSPTACGGGRRRHQAGPPCHRPV